MCNSLIISVLGGGNFASSKLTSNHCVHIKGRISAWIQTLVFVLFMLSFSACSSDEEAEKERVIDYKSQISDHEWVISEAIERIGDFGVDVKEGPAYCHFIADSVFFQLEETVTEFDDMGNILQTSQEIVPYGRYTYLIKKNKIQIDKQIFTITDSNGSLVLENKDWKLVLVENK